MDTLLVLGIGLLGLGVLLIVLEAFVPSGGILGLGALASAISGIVFLFQYDTTWGAIGTLGTVILGPMAFIWALNILPNTPLGRSMLGPSTEEIAREKLETNRAQMAGREELLGMEGVALTDMRPSGVVEIDGHRHDAIALGGIVDHGQRIRVMSVDKLTIEVRGDHSED
jgi:membrane-bound ClpP family serine protease